MNRPAMMMIDVKVYQLVIGQGALMRLLCLLADRPIPRRSEPSGMPQIHWPKKRLG